MGVVPLFHMLRLRACFAWGVNVSGAAVLGGGRPDGARGIRLEPVSQSPSDAHKSLRAGHTGERSVWFVVCASLPYRLRLSLTCLAPSLYTRL
jgi:hypothetical protein